MPSNAAAVLLSLVSSGRTAFLAGASSSESNNNAGNDSPDFSKTMAKTAAEIEPRRPAPRKKEENPQAAAVEPQVKQESRPEVTEDQHQHESTEGAPAQTTNDDAPEPLDTFASASATEDTLLSAQLAPLPVFLQFLVDHGIPLPPPAAFPALTAAFSQTSEAASPLQAAVNTLAALQAQWLAENGQQISAASAGDTATPEAKAALQQWMALLSPADKQTLVQAVQQTVAITTDKGPLPGNEALVVQSDVTAPVEKPTTESGNVQEKVAPQQVVQQAPLAQPARQDKAEAKPVARSGAPTVQQPTEEAEELSGRAVQALGQSKQENPSGQASEKPFVATLTSATNVPMASQSASSVPFAPVLTEVTQAPAPHASPAEQVVAQVKAAIQNGQSRIHIQLAPEELGKLDIRMEVAVDGTTKLHITADNRHALQLLQGEAKALEQKLMDVGLRPDSGSLSFNLRGDQQSSGQFLPQDQRHGYPAMEDDGLEEVSAQYYTLTVSEGVDIRA